MSIDFLQALTIGGKILAQSDQAQLIKWYQHNKRSLPWREAADPYPIWISEVMLQQTTVNTVIPYYKKFIKKFNTLKSLAEADQAEVMAYWSGLGYYSRAKNLYKSAQIIHQKKYFPKTYKELLKLPGFGSYTARAVSSLAFNEKVAVLDANVIRVMSRYLNFKKAWWTTKGKQFLQQEADQWVTESAVHRLTTPGDGADLRMEKTATDTGKSSIQKVGLWPSSIMNQALMELGSMVCTVQKPLCPACPLKKNCQAFKHNQVHLIPLKQKQKEKEIWLWKPLVCIKNNQVAFIRSHSLPVLKNYPVFPGKASKRSIPPARYDFIHSITHHIIYILISKNTSLPNKSISWMKRAEMQKQNPSSLIKKILSYYEDLI